MEAVLWAGGFFCERRNRDCFGQQRGLESEDETAKWIESERAVNETDYSRLLAHFCSISCSIRASIVVGTARTNVLLLKSGTLQEDRPKVAHTRVTRAKQFVDACQETRYACEGYSAVAKTGPVE